MTLRRTRRWRGVIAITFTASALGLFADRPSLLLVGVVGAVYAAYPHLTTAPAADYELERELDPEHPADGEPVEVSVTVTNTSDEFHPDTRIVDGVPPMLAVTDGSPRHGAALPTGDSATFSYTVTAADGIHAFEPATVIARDVSGAREVEVEVAADTTLAVSSSVEDAPLRSHTLRRVGQLTTDTGGSGVEFHRVREYHESDPLNRVDWRRYAKSGELATIDYRTEQAASVVVCIDARARAYRARREGEPHAVSRAIGATEQLVSTLSATTNTVGVAAVGREVVWVPPGTGDSHATRVRRALATEPALSAYPPRSDTETTAETGTPPDTDPDSDPDTDPNSDPASRTGDPAHDSDTDPDAGAEATSETRTGPSSGGGGSVLVDQVRSLRRHLGPSTQVVFVSPLPDHAAVEAVFTFESEGHAVTVLSPDVTTDETLGNRIAMLARRTHVRTLRESGIPVIDWDADETLGRAVLAHQEAST